MEVNTKTYEPPTPIRDRESDLNLDPENEIHSVKTINDLPLEVLEELFDYLTYTEKLISRLVCQKWNTQISSTLLKTSYYSLESKESLQVLLDSHDAGTNWKQLRISNRSDTGLILPTNFKISITALEVRFPRFESRICEYMRFLIGLPSLTTLKVSIIGGGLKDKNCDIDSDAQYLCLKEKIIGMYENLKILNITFPFSNYTALCKFLSGVNACSSLNLDSLSITEDWPTETKWAADKIADTGIDGARSFVCLPVFNTICKAAKTLKCLTLDFSSRTIVQILYKRILPWLTERDILKLENLFISRGLSRRNINDQFSTLQEFIKTQVGKGNLKNVALPWCPSADICQEFLKSLPKDIEFVGNVQNEHLSTEFPTQFKKLKSLCIGSVLTKHVFIDVHHKVRLFKFDLGKCRTSHTESPYGNMFDYLPNLTEIHIVGSHALALFDSDLQDIIFTLKHRLRVLELQDLKITDYGVLGVGNDDEDLQELIETKRIYFPQSSSDNLLPKMKNPLSSMVKLEKLVLVGIGSSISDVGIILGLKFGKQLKELRFSSESREITDFGLYSLGANNPGLEAFDGSFESGKISTVGIEKMKTQLLLTESTRKFKVVNEKPDVLVKARSSSVHSNLLIMRDLLNITFKIISRISLGLEKPWNLVI